MMHRVLSASLAILVASSCVVACGPRAELETPKAPRAALPQGGKAVVPGAPAVPWSRKSRAERIEYMGLVFYPRMKALFAELSDGTADTSGAPFRCQSCHGENMVDVGYSMPNGLFPLPATSPYEAAVAQDEKTARFMAEKVVPAARELLESEGVAEPVDCHSCHAREKSAP